MKSILIVTDPIPEGFSVQFKLLKSILQRMKGSLEIYVASTYFCHSKAEELRSLGYEVIEPKKNTFLGDRILGRFKKNNEAMLWLESWFREAIFSINEREITLLIGGKKFDHVMNLAATIPIGSEVWWNQGMPLEIILEQMSDSNVLAGMANRLGRWLIRPLNLKLLRKIRKTSGQMVVNSKYMYDLYVNLNFPPSGIVYSVYDLNEISSSTASPKRDFVLVYLGKETDLTPIRSMVDKNIKIVAFGSKIPVGTKLSGFHGNVEIRGYVTREELVDLYSNALFTAFPFTNEPFGYIPLESMACGTPVLTYNKQGPSETVVNGKTGWLADSADEFVKIATEVWNTKETNIDPAMCTERAGTFSVDNSVKRLLKLLSIRER